jgi:hypothetical protein
MDLHDLGGIVWAIFIVIAVISSIVRSAKRSMGSAQMQPQQQQMQVQQQVQTQQRVAPSAPPSPRVVVKRAPTATVVMPPPPRPLIFPTAAARKHERLFGPGLSVVRGIVALEVLGPPRALREWTPLV